MRFRCKNLNILANGKKRRVLSRMTGTRNWEEGVAKDDGSRAESAKQADPPAAGQTAVERDEVRVNARKRGPTAGNGGAQRWGAKVSEPTTAIPG